VPELAVDDVHPYYRESYVLQGVSLLLAKGAAVAVLGRNADLGSLKPAVDGSMIGGNLGERRLKRFRWQAVDRVGLQKGSDLHVTTENACIQDSRSHCASQCAPAESTVAIRIGPPIWAVHSLDWAETRLIKAAIQTASPPLGIDRTASTEHP
jgi:hypothetical protein